MLDTSIKYLRVSTLRKTYVDATAIVAKRIRETATKLNTTINGSKPDELLGCALGVLNKISNDGTLVQALVKDADDLLKLENGNQEGRKVYDDFLRNLTIMRREGSCLETFPPVFREVYGAMNHRVRGSRMLQSVFP